MAEIFKRLYGINFPEKLSASGNKHLTVFTLKGVNPFSGVVL